MATFTLDVRPDAEASSLTVGVSIAPEARRVGRPSTAAPFRDLVLAELLADPSVSTTDVLETARRAGYEGGKSAFFALTSVVRSELDIASPAARRAAAAETKREARDQKKAARAAQVAEWAADLATRKARKTQKREERLTAAARARVEREERRTLPPLGTPELPLDPNRLAALGRAWLASRDGTHKAIVDDRSRWRSHLEPAFGHLLPGEVDGAKIRAFVEAKLKTLTSTTINRCVGILSSLFTDLVEREIVVRNPVRALPRAVKRLYKPAHDPRTTPFLENRDDIPRLAKQLPPTMRAMFVLGVTSGLRCGELAALRWSDISGDMRRISVQRRVRHGRIDTPKSGRGRPVVVPPSTARMLASWRRETGGEGLVFKPAGRARFVAFDRVWGEQWRAGLRDAGIPTLTFYRGTRHTFASHWVLAGEPIEQLSRILGHSSIEITMRNYVHLRPDHVQVPDLFSPSPEGL